MEKLIFLPHCLRSPECKAALGDQGYICISCGKCKIGSFRKKAEEKGMKSARVYFNIGQAYYQLDLYSEAASYFEQAVKKKTDANYYEYLGSSYFHATNYKKAVEAFSAQLKFEPNNRAALLSLGTACNEAAEKAMNDGAEQDAFVFFMRAKSPLMKIAHDQNSTQIERENAKKLLESVDSRLKELKTKIK